MELTTNSFGTGLLMDTHPMQQGSDSLSNALNATFVTMNGNEIALLNDMGNARIDGAYLPHGYVPVGMKEFGGIIYIAAYNPITDRGLIGSFPSPQRRRYNKDGSLSGVFDPNVFVSQNTLIKRSVMIPLTEDSLLHPGDKYTLYSSDLSSIKLYLTNYNNILGNKVKSPKNNYFTLQAGILNSRNEFVDITKKLIRYNQSGEEINLENKSELYRFNSGYFINPTNYSDSSDDYELSIAGSEIDLRRKLDTMSLNTYGYKLVGPLYLKATFNAPTDFDYSLYGWRNDDLSYTIGVEAKLTYNCPDGISSKSGHSDDDYDDYYDEESEDDSLNLDLWMFPGEILLVIPTFEGGVTDFFGLNLYVDHPINANFTFIEKVKFNSSKRSDEDLYTIEFNPDIRIDTYKFRYNGIDWGLVALNRGTRSSEINLEEDNIELIFFNYNNCLSKLLENINNCLIIIKVSNLEYGNRSHSLEFGNSRGLVAYNKELNNYSVILNKLYTVNIGNNSMYPYTLIPVMNNPYIENNSKLLIDDLKQEGILDLSKLSSGTMNMNAWRFYNDISEENDNKTSILYGFESYPKYKHSYGDLRFDFWKVTGDINSNDIDYTYWDESDSDDFDNAFAPIIKDHAKYVGSFIPDDSIGYNGISDGVINWNTGTAQSLTIVDLIYDYYVNRTRNMLLRFDSSNESDSSDDSNNFVLFDTSTLGVLEEKETYQVIITWKEYNLLDNNKISSINHDFRWLITTPLFNNSYYINSDSFIKDFCNPDDSDELDAYNSLIGVSPELILENSTIDTNLSGITTNDEILTESSEDDSSDSLDDYISLSKYNTLITGTVKAQIKDLNNYPIGVNISSQPTIALYKSTYEFDPIPGENRISISDQTDLSSFDSEVYKLNQSYNVTLYDIFSGLHTQEVTGIKGSSLSSFVEEYDSDSSDSDDCNVYKYEDWGNLSVIKFDHGAPRKTGVHKHMVRATINGTAFTVGRDVLDPKYIELTNGGAATGAIYYNKDEQSSRGDTLISENKNKESTTHTFSFKNLPNVYDWWRDDSLKDDLIFFIRGYSTVHISRSGLTYVPVCWVRAVDEGNELKFVLLDYSQGDPKKHVCYPKRDEYGFSFDLARGTCIRTNMDNFPWDDSWPDKEDSPFPPTNLKNIWNISNYFTNFYGLMNLDELEIRLYLLNYYDKIAKVSEKLDITGKYIFNFVYE